MKWHLPGWIRNSRHTNAFWWRRRISNGPSSFSARWRILRVKNWSRNTRTDTPVLVSLSFRFDFEKKSVCFVLYIIFLIWNFSSFLTKFLFSSQKWILAAREARRNRALYDWVPFASLWLRYFFPLVASNIIKMHPSFEIGHLFFMEKLRMLTTCILVLRLDLFSMEKLRMLSICILVLRLDTSSLRKNGQFLMSFNVRFPE